MNTFCNSLRAPLLALVLQFSASLAVGQLYLHNERTDGDLSDFFAEPTRLTISDDQTFLRIDINATDIDLFTLQLPPNRVLESLIVRDYDSQKGNLTFIGLQSGTTLSAPPSDDFKAPIDYVVFGEWALDEDILPLMVATNDSISPPIDQRDLAFWANETGAPASFVLEVNSSIQKIPEPSSVLPLLGLVLCAAHRSRRIKA